MTIFNKINFTWPWKKTQSTQTKLNHTQGICGVRFFHDGVSLAHVKRDSNGKPHLVNCEFRFCQDFARAHTLAEMVKKYELEGIACVWIIPYGTYQLLSVEALPVPPEELSAAIRWHIKDRLNFPISDASVDYFTLPHQGTNNKDQVIYAIAAKKSYLISRADMIHNSGLKLTVIDVPDLVYCNIAKLYDTQRGIAMLGVRKEEAILAMIQKGQVYTLRRLQLKVSNSLAENSNVEAKLMADIQRSIDYYEIELGQPPIDKLLIAPPYGQLLPLLRARLTYSIEGLVIPQVLASDVELSEEMQIRNADAIGGALRQEDGDAATD